MSGQAEVEAFAAPLREIALSLAKKRFWTLLREPMAHPSDVARQEAMARAAAAEVARLNEPSPRIELNGHSASSLVRAIAEAGNVDPPAFEGIRGRARTTASQAATPEPSLPPLVDAMVGQLRLSGRLQRGSFMPERTNRAKQRQPGLIFEAAEGQRHQMLVIVSAFDLERALFQTEFDEPCL